MSEGEESSRSNVNPSGEKRPSRKAIAVEVVQVRRDGSWEPYASNGGRKAVVALGILGISNLRGDLPS